MSDTIPSNSVVPLQTCARPLCDETEYRINGYCSNYCEDVDGLEREVAALRAAASVAIYRINSMGVPKLVYRELAEVLADG